MRPTHCPSVVILGCLGALTASAQQSGQFLDAPMLAVPSTSQRMNAILDFDADGDLDAVGTYCPTSFKAGITLFANDGQGRLSVSWHAEWSQPADNVDNPFPVVGGDFDADGFDDFATALRREVLVYRSNGASAVPTLYRNFLLPLGDEIHGLAVGDFDGNTTLDLATRAFAFSGPLVTDRGIRVHHQLQTANPAQGIFLQPAPGTGMEIHAMFANGDATPDLLCVGATNVSLFAVGGTALHDVGTYSHGVGPIVTGATGDVDGDADQDIVVFGSNGQHQLIRRVGPNAFAPSAPVAGGPATRLADVDRDGDLDGVGCSGGGSPGQFSNSAPSYFAVAINDGTGLFAPSFEIPALGANHIAGAVDMDADGDVDLVAGRSIYFNVGGFHPVGFTDYSFADEPGDFDGDGDADLPTADLGTFARNDGTGLCSTAERLVPLPPVGYTFDDQRSTVDLDGDGALDVVVHDMLGTTPVRSRWLRNNGGGGLVDAGPITADGASFWAKYSTRLFAGDLDLDGDRDLVSAEWGEVPNPTPGWAPYSYYHARVFLRDAAGAFVFNGTQLWEWVCAVNDVDGDGFLDLVTADASQFRVRYGGASPFTTATVLGNNDSSHFFLREFDTGDLDSDGDLDIVVGTASSAVSGLVPRICEQVSPRSFVFHDGLLAPYQGSMYPTHLVDVDSDGNLDIVIGSRVVAGEPSSIVASSWFRGSAQPGMDFSYMGDQWPLALSFADFDGDGDLDVESYYPKHLVKGARFVAPDSGFRRQYGAATAGTAGQGPTLGATGPFRAGSAAELRAAGCAIDAPGLLLVGTDNQSAKLAGTGGFVMTLPILVAVNLFFPGESGLPGSGRLTIPYSVPLPAVGHSWYHQVISIDPGAQGGASVSNGLEIYYGP